MKNLQKNLIKTIKEKRIKPIPKIYFILKNAFYWLLGIFSIFFGGISINLIIYITSDLNQDNNFLFSKKIYLFLSSIPLVWLISLIFTIIFALYFFKNTNKGYKKTIWFYLTINLISSLLLGFLLNNSNLKENLDDYISKNFSFYHKLEKRRSVFWNHPERGFLSGKITKISKNYFYLKDFKQKTWKITYEKKFLNSYLLKKDYQIKIIGKKISNQEFLAKSIKPLCGKKCQETSQKNSRNFLKK
jgi:hypothetical protein